MTLLLCRNSLVNIEMMQQHVAVHSFLAQVSMAMQMAHSTVTAVSAQQQHMCGGGHLIVFWPCTAKPTALLSLSTEGILRYKARAPAGKREGRGNLQYRA